MSHSCFISYKSSDVSYKNRIVKRLGENRIQGKSLDEWIESDNIDSIMETIRNKYMAGTSVTLFLIGEHSSENEGLDNNGRNKQNFIIRELQATLFDRKNNPRDGLVGIVLPKMVDKVYLKKEKVNGKKITTLNISDSTVIREFSQNFWLRKNNEGTYDDDGHYAVLCTFCDFMNTPDYYIDLAYSKRHSNIAKLVHFKDIEHKGM